MRLLTANNETMTRTRLLLFALAFCTIDLACSKTSIGDIKSKVSVEFNGQKLKLQAGAGEYKNSPGLYFSFYYQRNNLLILDLSLDKIPAKNGAYQIVYVDSLQNGGLLSINDDDHILDYYNPLPTAENLFVIETLDLEKKEATGVFDLTFLFDHRFGVKAGGLPDTIYLRNGRFWVRFE
jgi:hypothetical protein